MALPLLQLVLMLRSDQADHYKQLKHRSNAFFLLTRQHLIMWGQRLGVIITEATPTLTSRSVRLKFSVMVAICVCVSVNEGL